MASVLARAADELREEALAFRRSRTVEVSSVAEAVEAAGTGFARIPWSALGEAARPSWPPSRSVCAACGRPGRGTKRSEVSMQRSDLTGPHCLERGTCRLIGPSAGSGASAKIPGGRQITGSGGYPRCHRPAHAGGGG